MSASDGVAAKRMSPSSSLSELGIPPLTFHVDEDDEASTKTRSAPGSSGVRQRGSFPRQLSPGPVRPRQMSSKSPIELDWGDMAGDLGAMEVATKSGSGGESSGSTRPGRSSSFDTGSAAPTTPRDHRPNSSTTEGSVGRMVSFTATSSNSTYSNGSIRLFKRGWKALKKSASGYSATPPSGPTPAETKFGAISSDQFPRETSKDRSSPVVIAATQGPNEREVRVQQLSDIWLSDIIPNWDAKGKKSVKQRRVRELFFRGIPTSVRGKAWPLALGNTLNIFPELQDVLIGQAAQHREDYMREKSEMDNADGDVGGFGGRAEVLMAQDARACQKAINLDLPRTFPDLSFFHAPDSPYKINLRDLLESFVLLRPDVGYSQGMSFLAAFLLLYLEPKDAFICFVNMMSKSCFLHFFRMKMPEVQIYMDVHEKLFAEELPVLYTHFRNAEIKPEMYLVNWIMSMYCQALPLECTSRVWDVYFLDGDVMLFRVALGILRLYAAQFLQMPFDEIAYFISHIPDTIDPDELLTSVRKVQGCTPGRYNEIYKEVEAKYR